MQKHRWGTLFSVVAFPLIATAVGCSESKPAAVDVAVDTATPDSSTTDSTATDSAGHDLNGDDATVVTPEAGLAAAVAALCPGYAQRFCAETERCGCTAAPGFPGDCQTSFEAACTAQLTSYLPFAQSGEAVFRPENAATCFEALVDVYAACVPLPRDNFFMLCPILTPPGGFTDLPALGEACEGSCAPGLRCGTEGLCKVPGAASAPCQSPYDCAMDLVCADETCQAPRQSDSGKACAGPEECGGDTQCLASVRKTCRAPSADGPCHYDEDCAPGRYCPEATDGDEGSRRCTPAGAKGELCGNGVVCAEGLACDMWGGTCGELPQQGDNCAQGPMGPVVCAVGLSCLNGTCGAPPAEGEACAMGAPNCAFGLGCAFETDGSFCRAKRTVGGECQNDQTCVDGAFCNFSENRCELLRMTGEPCSDGNECGLDGACLPDEVFAFRCAPRPADGGECFLDDCQTGLICRTPYTAGVCAPALCQAIQF